MKLYDAIASGIVHLSQNRLRAGLSILGILIGIASVLCMMAIGVGARRIDRFYQFLTESVCLCLCGGVLGIAGGWLAAHGIARLAIRIVPIVPEWPVVLSVPWIVISVLFSIFMGVIFGVYPAIRASLMSPMDALRTDA